LREDSLQLQRPNPAPASGATAACQQARPLRVTTVCIHIYGFKHYLPLLPSPGLNTISDYYVPAASCRRMDLTATARARATSMGLLLAYWSSWPERYCATGQTTMGPQGAGQRVNLEHGTQSLQQASRHCMCRIIALTNSCSFLPEASSIMVWSRKFECEHHILFR
jgi:hypothetical protein